ncbi:MAG: ABC transporter ATP-binding protein [Desulfobacula sp.]|uniref:ABC transporter ATP-binding protein n=1 Tax=Desulfobacula sp. TaxID=2593537 RepID=UPI0025B9C651|nr:ABC transporter ATP-binding protein [Desulfobacula sp.]MCD4718524.1 ABC transporter ATP-binding protein [Desulfobacula sp.]
MTPVIEVEHLSHQYGKQTIYEDLNFTIPPGKIYGLLGKNGVGKTTLIKILMGFLRPGAGKCRVFGEDSHNLSPDARTRIGLLFEGHLSYEFMSIKQIEKFYAPFYPAWDRDIYYQLVNKLRLDHDHLIKNMSCGQRSQVVLGLIMAQQPELLLLDDYSIGLDAGYRRLFLDDMREFLNKGRNRTVFLTSHVIQDMEDFVDEVIFLEQGGGLLTTSLTKFTSRFRCYRVLRDKKNQNRLFRPQFGSQFNPLPENLIKNIEEHADYWDFFSFAEKNEVRDAVQKQGLALNDPNDLKEVPMSLEDAFIGYTGRY